MTDVPASFEKTYRRVDRYLIGDEYGWVTDLDYFDESDYPVELIEEVWERKSVRTFWKLPANVYSCTKVADCDEDAVSWEQQPDGQWHEVCAVHLATVVAVTS